MQPDKEQNIIELDRKLPGKELSYFITRSSFPERTEEKMISSATLVIRGEKRILG